jgi:hypothetical protein
MSEATARKLVKPKSAPVATMDNELGKHRGSSPAKEREAIAEQKEIRQTWLSTLLNPCRKMTPSTNNPTRGTLSFDASKSNHWVRQQIWLSSALTTEQELLDERP